MDELLDAELSDEDEELFELLLCEAEELSLLELPVSAAGSSLTSSVGSGYGVAVTTSSAAFVNNLTSTTAFDIYPTTSPD